jgi:hypothetical protein
MKVSRWLTIGAALAGGAAIAAGAKWHRTWGATPEEAASSLPGDDLVQDPAFRSTRAITIDAAPEAIWPWLKQMGLARGGWYSYDKLLQIFWPLPARSATAIESQWQDLKEGDPVDLISTMIFRVGQLIPNEALVLVADENQRPMQPWVKSWAFVLKPLPGGATRLLIRETSGWDSLLVGALTAGTAWLWFIGTRRLLKNLKALVEAT